MDSTVLKTMLESQERAFKTALDIVVTQMNGHIDKLEGKVSDLTSSLEFTQREVDDLKSTAKEYEKEKKDFTKKIDQLTEQVESSAMKIKELEERTNYQEDYSRRNNVRISGVEEHEPNETWEQTTVAVTSLLENKLLMPGIELERAHRVGVRRDARPRPIVARFSRFCDREAVMRNSNKLRGTNIFVNEDLCASSQAVKNAQMPQLKQARAQGKIAYFRHTKLIIKERTNKDAENRMQQQTSAEGAQGVTGDKIASKPEPASGEVVVEVAGAWSSARNADLPTLPSPRLDGPPPRSSSTAASSPAASTQSKKKFLRSAAKQ